MYTFAHTVPTLDVSIDRTGVRSQILDLSPFNGFTLTCMATSSVAGTLTPIKKRITWMRSVDGGSPQQLTNGAANVDSVVTVTEDNLLRATSMSMLSVNTTMSGSHSYTCTAQLVVSPAPDSITGQDQTTVSIVGELKVIIITTIFDAVCVHNCYLHFYAHTLLSSCIVCSIHLVL